MPAIHGDKGVVRIIENGQVIALTKVTQWEASEDASAERRHYAGDKYPSTRKNVMGWRGRLTFDVVNPELPFLIQRINDAEDAGVNVPAITLVLVERYDARDSRAGSPAGTSHIFSDVVLIFDSHSGAGKPDLIQQSCSFDASRKRVAPV